MPLQSSIFPIEKNIKNEFPIEKKCIFVPQFADVA